MNQDVAVRTIEVLITSLKMVEQKNLNLGDSILNPYQPPNLFMFVATIPIADSPVTEHKIATTLHNLSRENVVTPAPFTINDITPVLISDVEKATHEISQLYGVKLARVNTDDCFTLHVNLLPNERYDEAYQRAQIIFKLFKEGSLNFLGYRKNNAEQFWRKPYQIYWRLPPNKVRYEICSNEESSFVSHWENFREIPADNFAVYRFHQADFKFQYPDRFLDYVLSIESLLVPNRSVNKSSRIKDKGAKILLDMDESLDRKKVEYYLESRYKKRNDIVHGSITDIAPCSLSDDEKAAVKDEYEKEGIDAINDWELSASWEKYIIPLRCCNRNLIKYFYLNGVIGNPKEREKLIVGKRNRKDVPPSFVNRIEGDISAGVPAQYEKGKVNSDKK